MESVNLKLYETFSKDWALLTAGSWDDYNTMTVSWGGLGSLWGMNVATVYVRPNRYTYEFMERNEYFTVSFYPGECKDALKLLGVRSGRECDKVSLSGLTPEAMEQGVTFRQASCTILCKKLYAQDMDASAIPQSVLGRYYGSEPVHRMYIGQVIAIRESGEG